MFINNDWLGACMIVLAAYAFMYKDYNLINNTLLQEIKKQNLDLKLSMQMFQVGISLIDKSYLTHPPKYTHTKCLKIVQWPLIGGVLMLFSFSLITVTSVGPVSTWSTVRRPPPTLMPPTSRHFLPRILASRETRRQRTTSTQMRRTVTASTRHGLTWPGRATGRTTSSIQLKIAGSTRGMSRQPIRSIHILTVIQCIPCLNWI